MTNSLSERLWEQRRLAGVDPQRPDGLKAPEVRSENERQSTMVTAANSAEAITSTQTVFVVEDDLDTREAISELLSPSGLKVRTFGSAEEFLGGYSANGPSCLLLDEKLPGLGGSELLRRLHSEGVTLPTIVVTAYATTAYTVAAMRHGATTVLDKPCSDSVLQDAVREALDKDQARLERDQAAAKAKQKLADLTDSERQVLQMVLDGTPNKQIARRLEVCVRTVEARRSRIYQTTGVNSVAGLVRLCVAAGFIDA